MSHPPLYLSTNGDKTIELASILNVEKYGCGVVNVTGKINHNESNLKKTDRLFLCSDICEESFIENVKLPILCEIFRNGNGVINNDIFNIVWISILRPAISSIRLYISNFKGEIISVEESSVNCTLLIVPNKQKNV